jgi:hypothetical protein
MMPEQCAGQQRALRENTDAPTSKVSAGKVNHGAVGGEKRDYGVARQKVGAREECVNAGKSGQGRVRLKLSNLEILELVGKSSAFALCWGSVPVLWVVLLARLRHSSALNSEDRRALWDATYPEPVLLPNGTTAQGRLLDVVGGSATHYLGYILFYPGALYFYFGKEHFPNKAVGAAVIAYYATIFVGYVMLGIESVLLLIVALSVLFVVLALWHELPSNCKIPKLILYQFLGIQLAGNVFVIYGLPRFPSHDEGFQLAFYMAIMPFFREVTRFLATQTAWYFRFDAHVGGDEITVLHRECAHVFLSWVLILWATYFRLLVSNLGSSEKTAAVVLYQATLELVLRLTLYERGKMLKKAVLFVKQRCFGRNSQKAHHRATVLDESHLTKVAPAAVLANQLTVRRHFVQGEQEEATQKLATRDFVSMVILMDMMAEYVGIFASFIYLVAYVDKPVSAPYPWYIEQVFEPSKADFTSLIYSTALQLVMELLVDSVCLYFDRRTDPLSIWKSLDKRKFVPLFMLASWYGTLLADMAFKWGDDLTKCWGTDMCFCVKNGLLQGGVREAYCLKIYPNATWEADPISLGMHKSNMTHFPL